jgi:hypothetical protein
MPPQGLRPLADQRQNLLHSEIDEKFRFCFLSVFHFPMLPPPHFLDSRRVFLFSDLFEVKSFAPIGTFFLEKINGGRIGLQICVCQTVRRDERYRFFVDEMGTPVNGRIDLASRTGGGEDTESLVSSKYVSSCMFSPPVLGVCLCGTCGEDPPWTACDHGMVFREQALPVFVKQMHETHPCFPWGQDRNRGTRRPASNGCDHASGDGPEHRLLCLEKGMNLKEKSIRPIGKRHRIFVVPVNDLTEPPSAVRQSPSREKLPLIRLRFSKTVQVLLFQYLIPFDFAASEAGIHIAITTETGKQGKLLREHFKLDPTPKSQTKRNSPPSTNARGEEMYLFKHMKISSKLVLGFTTMVVFLAVVGWVGFRNAQTIHTSLIGIFANNLPSMDFLIEADRDLQQLLVAERTLIFVDPGTETFKKQVKDFETNLKQSDERWKKFKALQRTPEKNRSSKNTTGFGASGRRFRERWWIFGWQTPMQAGRRPWN